MKTVPVEQAVGMVLCHDITQIIPGEFKGRAFKKGHIIQNEDVQKLKDIGKENIFVFDMAEGLVHEDDAALRIAEASAGQNITYEEPKEGKVEFKAAVDGLFRVNTEALFDFHEDEKVMFATIHGGRPVKAGDKLAGTRIIPLVIEKRRLERAEQVCRKNGPLIEVVPYKKFRVGIVTTGTEVFSGRIQDKFGSVVANKVKALGGEVAGQILVPDSVAQAQEAARSFLEREDVDIVALTGGMSVDPDDISPSTIRGVVDEVITYGVPVLPGAMFMIGYAGGKPVVGLPGCVMYAKTSIFDLVLPYLACGLRLERRDLIKLAHGGFCTGCKECRWPDCAYGKSC